MKTLFFCKNTLLKSSFKKNPQGLVIFAFFTISCIFPYSVYATGDVNQPEEPKIPLLSEEQAQTLPRESTQGDDIPLLDEKDEQQLDKLQQKGSELLISAADWLDSFFDDPRYTEEENRSRARLKLKFGYSHLYDFEFKPSIDLRLKLPKTNNKANIYLQANDDNDFDTDATPIPDEPGGSSNDDENLSIGIQYFLKAGEKYNITTHFGLSLNHLYGGIRYRNTHTLFTDDIKGRFTDRLRYYTDDGWDNRISYDIESNIATRYFFRTSFNAVIAEKYEGIPFSGLLQIYKVLSIDKVLLWENGVYLDTEPDFDVTDIQIKLRYRQRFFRDWLVLEVAPQVTFPKEYDYEINPGLIVRFEADFGYLNDRKAYQSIFSF